MGWQPYSIAQKNKDGSITYKQYNRMDPRFMIYGWIADIKENLANKRNLNNEKNRRLKIRTIKKRFEQQPSSKPVLILRHVAVAPSFKSARWKSNTRLNSNN